MNKVVVFGASYCSPCQILKDWMESGLDARATWVYHDLSVRNSTALADFRIQHGINTIGATFPGVAILDEDDNIIDWGNGKTQTWINDILNANSTVGQESEEEEYDGADEEVDLFLGMDIDDLMIIGGVLFIIIAVIVMIKAKWL